MRKRINFLLLAAAFLVFAAFASGGCGGSSSSYPGKTDSALYLPSMFDIRATPEFTAMIDELKAEGVWAKIESQELVFINDSVDAEVISKFKNGAILTVYQPTEYDMAGLFKFLKSMSADISGIDTGTDIEILAVTKRTAAGSVVSEDNIVRLDNIFFYVVPDISTLVSVDADSTAEDVEKEYIDTQVERWKRYYYWRASLDEKMLSNAKESAVLKSSAAEGNNIIDISRVLSGNYDWSFYSMKNWDKVSMDPATEYVYLEDEYIMYRGTRTNILEYNVYSAHSFTDHSDYFVVSSNFSTKPKRVDTQARVVLPYQQLGTELTTELAYTWFRGLRGYTSGLDSKITFGECVKTSMPNGAAQGTQYSENFTWSNDGVFAGHDFGEFYGVHFSGNLSFDAENITVLNNSGKSSAAFSSTIDRPVDVLSTWSEAEANEASKKELKFPAFAVMKVGRDIWKNGYDSVALDFSGSVSEAEVASNWYYRTNDGTTLDSTERIDVTFSKNFSLSVKNPNPPMHSTVHQRYYALNRHGGIAAVRVHSESDWQLIVESSARSWITFEKTSGKATGPEGEWVKFTVPENTSGSGRHVNIMLVASPYDDKGITEATIFEMYQSNNEGISAGFAE